MRIIAGERRGHNIEAPRDSSKTRPTSNLVREAVFNILGDRVEGRTFLDLFAGTGAMGLEALSRRAEFAIFVEMDRENVSLVLRNAATLRYGDRTRVRNADVYRWVRSFEPADDRPVMAFLDPPYTDYESRTREVGRMVASLVEKLPTGSIIALEAGRGIRALGLSETAWDVRRYGNKRVAFRVLPEPGERSKPGEESAAEPDPAAKVSHSSAQPSAPKKKSPSRSSWRRELNASLGAPMPHVDDEWDIDNDDWDDDIEDMDEDEVEE